ncbi:hypothetical protein [Wolbachia endosymbiont (group A) of Anomoia purmunda]|nr:hypothetical protein [Wolbachia endosymbiont (group A) of Anomoia purmunda]
MTPFFFLDPSSQGTGMTSFFLVKLLLYLNVRTAMQTQRQRVTLESKL